MQTSQRLYPAVNLTPINQITSSLPATSDASNPYRNRMQPFQSQSIFGFDDTLFQARAAQAALADIDVKNVNMLRPADMFSNYLMGQDTHAYPSLASSSTDVFDASALVSTVSQDQQQQQDSMASLQQVMRLQHYSAASEVMAMHHYGAPAQFPQYPMAPSFAATASVVNQAQGLQRYPIAAPASEIDTDPRELERFAEHFKQRRIKLGVTQADVGKALAHLKMPGVGSLSQSTICRFESLTLSHNNMVALKPILHSWLEKAEEAMKQKDTIGDLSGILPNTDKKRKRTSIAAPEKRLLEEYFRQQPRPSGERIAAIADKLDLKKNVVRVWFCNQRQKQKRDFRSQFRCRGGVPGGALAGANQMARGLMPTAGGTAAAGKCSFGYFE